MAKVCILFRPDDETTRVIEEIVRQLGVTGGAAIKGRGELPYHMTIIGGGSLPEEGLDVALGSIVSVIKPFSEGVIPEVFDLEPAQHFDDYLAIRLKLRGYVITGDRQKNRQLRQQLHSKFHFDGPRHVTLLRVDGERRYIDMDEKLPRLEELLAEFRSPLLQMKLLPEVWIRPEGSNLWQPWVLR